MERWDQLGLSYCCDKGTCATCARRRSWLRTQFWITTIGLALFVVSCIAVAIPYLASSKTTQPGTGSETSACSPTESQATYGGT